MTRIPLAESMKLRRNAEQRLKKRKTKAAGVGEDSTHLAHELEVHRVELEMQNEELRASRQAAEAALARFTEIFEFAPIGYATLDLRGILGTINLAGARLLGRERALLLGRSLMESVTSKDLVRLDSFLRNAALLHDQEKVECDVQVNQPSRGNPLHVHLTATVLSREERTILLALEDISERVHHEVERTALLIQAQQARAEAEAANRSKDQFLATLSHELRTPLSTLVLQVQQLRRVRLDEERFTRAVDAIERATRAQARLVNDLLDVSRITAGKLSLELQEVDLSAVVREAVEAARPNAERKRMELGLSVEEQLTVWGDPARLRQVVANLLDNAVKFTPEGGRIAVSLQKVAGRGQLRVRDTGCGVEREFLDRMFRPYSQEDGAATTRRSGGLGLGLAICHALAEAHGGTIVAESDGRNRGTTFTVTLPLMASAAEKALQAAEQVATESMRQGIEGVRILLVEDDSGTRDALSEALAQLNAEVRAAVSAEQALEEFRDFHPHLLISDIAMPGEDGYSLIKRIRALGKDRGGACPAVALTAHAFPDDRDRAMKAGFQVHLSKPVDLDRLVGAVKHLLPPLHTQRSRNGVI